MQLDDFKPLDEKDKWKAFKQNGSAGLAKDFLEDAGISVNFDGSSITNLSEIKSVIRDVIVVDDEWQVVDYGDFKKEGYPVKYKDKHFLAKLKSEPRIGTIIKMTCTGKVFGGRAVVWAVEA